MIGATSHRALALAIDWNVVVTVHRGAYQHARDLLKRLGQVRPTGFYNVLAMKVRSPRELLVWLRDMALDQPDDVYSTLSHVSPVTEMFAFADADDLAARAEQTARAWLPRLAGKRFHVRVHRRGARGEVHSTAEQVQLTEALARALLARGELAGIDYDDPDVVIDVETLGWEAGVAMWTREELDTFPLLEAGFGLARPSEAELWRARQTMVREQVEARGVGDRRVLWAMQSIPRHAFLPRRLRSVAYVDCPLGIGAGQTVAPPRVVGAVLQGLELHGGEHVLEIGAGCGYQTALLARLAGHVIALESDPRLAERARRALARLGLGNVTLIRGDGASGYADGAPYDAIAVDAGLTRVPEAITRQLADGGRLIAPIGERPFQRLLELRRHGDELERIDRGPCTFAPLRRGAVV